MSGAAARGRGSAPAIPPPAWRIALGEFWTGFSEPSRLAALTLVAAFAVSVAGAFLYFSPRTLAGPLGDYLPRSAQDAEGFVTVDALRLGAEVTERPLLLVLGPSTLAQAFGEPREVDAALAGAPGGPWKTHMLVTPLQSPFDQIALLETALADRPRGAPPVVVALGMGIQRLAWSPERLIDMEAQGRIGLRSDQVDSEMERIGATPRPRYGSYLLDNYRFVLVNATEALARLALARPARRQVAAYDSGDVVADADRARETLTARLLEGPRNRDYFFGLHARLAARLAQIPGVSLVLIEERLSPALLEAEGLAALDFSGQTEFAAFAARIGAQYWPVMSDARLVAAEYHDDLHVRSGPPQDRVRAAFADRFAPYAARLTEPPR